MAKPALIEGFSRAGRPNWGPLRNNRLHQPTVKVEEGPTWNPLPFRPLRNHNEPTTTPITAGNLPPLQSLHMSRPRDCRWQCTHPAIAPTCLEVTQLAEAYPCWPLHVPRFPLTEVIAPLLTLNLRDGFHEPPGYQLIIAGHSQPPRLPDLKVCTNVTCRFVNECD